MTVAPHTDPHQYELVIGGMTCASCAARVEKKLNRLDGVTASVNYATEKAFVTAGADVSVDDLIGTVEATGYTAAVPAPPEPDIHRCRRGVRRRRRCDGGSWSRPLLALPVLVLSMVPPLQFDNWQWLALTLASPVVVWGALPFHRAAWTNLRHGAATMDTLVVRRCSRRLRLVAVGAVPRRRRDDRHADDVLVHGLRR